MLHRATLRTARCDEPNDVGTTDDPPCRGLVSRHLPGRIALQIVVLVALVVGLQGGLQAQAWAAERVDCFSPGPRTPITLITSSEALCFGGSVGHESVSAFVEDFSSGDHNVRVFFRSPNTGSETLNVTFEPGEFSQLNVHVVAIEII